MSGLFGQPFDQFGILVLADTVSDPDPTFTDILIYRKGNTIYLRGTDGVPHVLGSATGLTGILPLANGGSGADLSTGTANAATVLLTNKVANGGSAVAFALDNTTDLANAAAVILALRSAGAVKAAILGSGGLLAPTAGPSATQQHTLPAVASGTVIVSGASSISDDALRIGNGTHRLSGIGVRLLSGGVDGMIIDSAQPDGTSSWQFRLQQTVAMVTGGSCILRLETAAQQLLGGVGSLQLGCPSLGQADAMAYGEWVTASGTVTAGEVVVHSGAKLVATAGASAGLTTIAGVALTTGTNAAVLIAKRGRVYTNADAGITVGQLLRTSGAVAGNVLNGGTAVGSIVGRACESTGATVAGKILVDLTLS